MSDRKVSAAYGLAYASVLPFLQEIARKHGYALAVHGSMATDMDLLAAPWTDDAGDPTEMIQEICRCVRGTIVANPETEPKPHGRLAWNILIPKDSLWPRFDLVPWLDISVMPRKQVTHVK